MYPGHPGLSQLDQQRQMVMQMRLQQLSQGKIMIPKDPVQPKFLAACRTGDLEYVNVLLERGVDVDSRDDDVRGWTGLHEAACKGHLAVLEVLIEKGADLNPRAKLAMLTPVYLAVANSRVEAALLLISRGADLHLTTDKGETLLQKAAIKGLGEVVEELIRKKVYIHEKDDDGDTALGRRSLTVLRKV